MRRLSVSRGRCFSYFFCQDHAREPPDSQKQNESLENHENLEQGLWSFIGTDIVRNVRRNWK